MDNIMVTKPDKTGIARLKKEKRRIALKAFLTYLFNLPCNRHCTLLCWMIFYFYIERIFYQNLYGTIWDIT